MNPSGGARPGAGRKQLPLTKQGMVSARLFPSDADTLKSFPSTSTTLTLLAQGLRLGEGNLPHLTEEEKACLQSAFGNVFLSVMSVRYLPQNLLDVEHPAAEGLAQKLTGLGDFELLALVLRNVPLHESQIAHGTI